MNIYVEGLRVGDVVIALQGLDPEGARVTKGCVGVCFAEVNHYGDGGGHMVRWFDQNRYPAGACNVYAGDVGLLT